MKNRSKLIIKILAEKYNTSQTAIDNAVALTDIFKVVDILEKEGSKGLKKLVIKPLNPISPELASPVLKTKEPNFPLLVECKYDGIRIMSHKISNLSGQIKYAAFTRRKNNWLELIDGLENSLNMIPANSFILDGELHGSSINWEQGGKIQSTVYEVYRYLQGYTNIPIKLDYVIFDILYLNGQDITHLPLFQRREFLKQLILPLKNFNMLLPISLSEGLDVNNMEEYNKTYNYFCHQGYEGIIAKNPNATYSLGKRTDNWVKRKKQLYLDMVITGALWSTSTKGPAIFSTYILSCQDKNGWREIGRVEGLSLEKNCEIIRRINMEGILTGKTIEHRTSTATRYGIAIIPSIVVTVKFENVVKDTTGKHSLRNPNIIYVRPKGDAAPEDVDTYQTIRYLYMKKRLS